MIGPIERYLKVEHFREAAAHLEARAAGEDALGEHDTARSLRVGRDALTVRAAEIERQAKEDKS